MQLEEPSTAACPLVLEDGEQTAVFGALPAQPVSFSNTPFTGHGNPKRQFGGAGTKLFEMNVEHLFYTLTLMHQPSAFVLRNFTYSIWGGGGHKIAALHLFILVCGVVIPGPGHTGWLGRPWNGRAPLAHQGPILPDTAGEQPGPLWGPQKGGRPVQKKTLFGLSGPGPLLRPFG